ncbi:MAG: hypothetical protein EOP39_22755, partial [Rubrivivax sp.]
MPSSAWAVVAASAAAASRERQKRVMESGSQKGKTVSLTRQALTPRVRKDRLRPGESPGFGRQGHQSPCPLSRPNMLRSIWRHRARSPPMRSTRFSTSRWLTAALVSCATCAFAAPPPAAPSQPVTDTLHGVQVADPYRNLENVKSPQTQEWLKAQGAYAEEQLARIQGREAMTQRIAELARATGDLVVALTRMPGDKLFYLKRKAGENQYKLIVRQGMAGAEQVLVDPEAMAKAKGGVPHAVNYFVPSWDGRHIAYGVSAGGSEDASLYVMKVATGELVGEPIPRVHEGLLSWTPDSKAFTFN